MPYTQCAHCARLTYSAARWSSVEDCPQCGRRLPQVNALAHRVVFGSSALPGAALAAVPARGELNAEGSVASAEEES